MPGIGNCIPMIYDTAGILESSPAWTAEDKAGLQQWTREFRSWMHTSRQGLIQFNGPSNHGTTFDFVNALFSLYVTDPVTVEASLEHYAYERMPGQLAPDGSNVLEMERADNLLYHCSGQSTSRDTTRTKALWRV